VHSAQFGSETRIRAPIARPRVGTREDGALSGSQRPRERAAGRAATRVLGEARNAALRASEAHISRVGGVWHRGE